MKHLKYWSTPYNMILVRETYKSKKDLHHSFMEGPCFMGQGKFQRWHTENNLNSKPCLMHHILYEKFKFIAFALLFPAEKNPMPVSRAEQQRQHSILEAISPPLG